MFPLWHLIVLGVVGAVLEGDANKGVSDHLHLLMINLIGLCAHAFWIVIYSHDVFFEN